MLRQRLRESAGAGLPGRIGIQERAPPTGPCCRCAGLLTRHGRTCPHCSGAMPQQNTRTTACCIWGSACPLCRLLGSFLYRLNRPANRQSNAMHFNIFAVSAWDGVHLQRWSAQLRTQRLLQVFNRPLVGALASRLDNHNSIFVGRKWPAM